MHKGLQLLQRTKTTVGVWACVSVCVCTRGIARCLFCLPVNISAGRAERSWNPISTDHPACTRNYSQFVKWNQNLICLFNDPRLLSGPTKHPVKAPLPCVCSLYTVGHILMRHRITSKRLNRFVSVEAWGVCMCACASFPHLLLLLLRSALIKGASTWASRHARTTTWWQAHDDKHSVKIQWLFAFGQNRKTQRCIEQLGHLHRRRKITAPGNQTRNRQHASIYDSRFWVGLFWWPHTAKLVEFDVSAAW